MPNNYSLNLYYRDNQAHLELCHSKKTTRIWFGSLAINIYSKALRNNVSIRPQNTIYLNKEQVQHLFIEITNIYQNSLLKYNIAKDLGNHWIPKGLINIAQSLLLMLRMNNTHQNYKCIQNFYFEEFRTLNSEDLEQTLFLLVKYQLIQKIETQDHQIFFDKNPIPHPHLYFKQQQKLIDCSKECYQILKPQSDKNSSAKNITEIFQINY